MANAFDVPHEETLPSRERDTLPAPAPSAFDDAPAWAKALFVAVEECRAAVANLGDEMATHTAAMRKLNYRVGGLSVAMLAQEHRTREVEAKLPAALAPVIPMRGN